MSPMFPLKSRPPRRGGGDPLLPPLSKRRGGGEKPLGGPPRGENGMPLASARWRSRSLRSLCRAASTSIRLASAISSADFFATASESALACIECQLHHDRGI